MPVIDEEINLDKITDEEYNILTELMLYIYDSYVETHNAEVREEEEE